MLENLVAGTVVIEIASIVMPVFPALSEVKRSVACGASATKFSSKVI